MKKLMNIKVGIALLAATVAVVVAVAAYAYWTTGGSGTGTASTGTSTDVVIHGVAAPALYPGGSSTVTFTIDNPSPGKVMVGSIHFTGITAVTGCVGADFTMPDVPVNLEFPNGNGQAVTPTGTVTYADSSISQDTCKNQTLQLNFTSN